MSKKPVFAVVGHPNKGKSSIVSTLSRQDAVSISDISGTTTQSQSFAMEVEGSSLYTLVDTPGFQRRVPALSMSWTVHSHTHLNMKLKCLFYSGRASRVWR